MCLRYSLQGTKYQHCFRGLTNLFCKKKWKEDLHPGPVPEWEKQKNKSKQESKKTNKKTGNLPICQHQGIFHNILYIRWGTWDLTSTVCWVAGLEIFATIIQSFCWFTCVLYSWWEKLHLFSHGTAELFCLLSSETLHNTWRYHSLPYY